ncbi:hypothetical protein C2S51_037114 [Perilla frutescens var. frutescens]|nr:hypothetical protein C2S51_037114 [Perilla frutescens var. frutescens]
MGGGNGQKAKMARERNMEKLKGQKGSQLEANKKAMSIQAISFVQNKNNDELLVLMLLHLYNFNGRDLQCKVCMQTFICTTSEVKCREHAEAKHPKADVYACFPHLKK